MCRPRKSIDIFTNLYHYRFILNQADKTKDSATFLLHTSKMTPSPTIATPITASQISRISLNLLHVHVHVVIPALPYFFLSMHQGQKSKNSIITIKCKQ